MKSSDLKEHIVDSNLIDTILEDLGCKHIVKHDGYYSCANPNGNNKNAVTVYDNYNLTTLNHTRDIAKTAKTTDIFDLAMYYKDYTFPEVLKYIHSLLGLDYYQEKEEVCESLQILQMLKGMQIGECEEDNEPLKPIPEKILEYYLPYGNKLFKDDGISLETQRFFEVSFDPCTSSICIPIRDEIGSLIAVKARRIDWTPECSESKYFFLEPGAKSRVLYGLYQNIKIIQQVGTVFVGESEKFVQQLYDMGYYGVSTGGTKISKTQVEMLSRLNVKIVFCYDKDMSEEKMKKIADMFLDGISIYAMLDTDNILKEKESPSDNEEKWQHMLVNNVYQIK